MKHLLPMVALIAGAPALAQDQVGWEAAGQALLVESLDGNLARAQQAYENLLNASLTGDDPMRPRILLALARVYQAQGDMDSAEDALKACVQSGIDRQACLREIGRLTIEQEAITRVPVQWTFDNPEHGVLHPRQYWDQGSIRLAEVNGEAALMWTTPLAPLNADKLVVGFDEPRPTPRQVILRASTLRGPAELSVQVETLDGHRYMLPHGNLKLTAGEWQTYFMSYSEFIPMSVDAPDVLDARKLHRMYLIDRTQPDGQRQNHQILLGALVIE